MDCRAILLKASLVASCYHSGVASRAVSQILHARSPKAVQTDDREARVIAAFRGVGLGRSDRCLRSVEFIISSAAAVAHTNIYNQDRTEVDALVMNRS